MFRHGCGICLARKEVSNTRVAMLWSCNSYRYVACQTTAMFLDAIITLNSQQRERARELLSKSMTNDCVCEAATGALHQPYCKSSGESSNHAQTNAFLRDGRGRGGIPGYLILVPALKSA